MPIPLILAPILTELAKNGLNILAGAITAKGKEVVEEQLGVNIEDSLKSEEGIFKLRELEIKHEEFLINTARERAELELKDKALDIENTKDAREMNARIQESQHATYIAKVAPYWLDFIIISSTLLLAFVIMFEPVPDVNEKLVYMAFGSLLTMCGTILNFHRGTSAQSKSKDETINLLSKIPS